MSKYSSTTHICYVCNKVVDPNLADTALKSFIVKGKTYTGYVHGDCLDTYTPSLEDEV